MSKKATTTDADIILKLYELRREPEIRKARTWWTIEFWPQSADDVLKIANSLGTTENLYMRQVGGYWEMAAALAVHGTVNQDLFLEPSFSGEMFFYFAKLKPFLAQLRETLSPTLFANVEKVINSSDSAKDFLRRTEERIAARRKMMTEAAMAKAS
jgi:hypothetical protein